MPLPGVVAVWVAGRYCRYSDAKGRAGSGRSSPVLFVAQASAQLLSGIFAQISDFTFPRALSFSSSLASWSFLRTEKPWAHGDGGPFCMLLGRNWAEPGLELGPPGFCILERKHIVSLVIRMVATCRFKDT